MYVNSRFTYFIPKLEMFARNVSVILVVSAARKLCGNTLTAKVANIKCAK